MKDVFRKIGAICMIAILLLSTSSFSVFKHFCGDNLVSISLEKIDDCCDSKDSHKPLASNKLNFSKKDCCKNETSVKELSILESNKTLKVSKSQVVFITAYYYNFVHQLQGFSVEHYFKDFSPPSIVLNKQIQFQTFLI